MVNIIVVFRKIEDARNIRNALVRNGFTVTAVCSTGLTAIGMFDSLSNGIIVCGYQMKDMMYTEILENMPEDFRMLLVARESLLADLDGSEVESLPLPLRVSNLTQKLSDMQRVIETRIKEKHNKPRKRSAKSESEIEEAKKLLMNRKHMTEPEAHRYLQKTAMDTGTSLAETAGMVLDLFS